MVNELFFKSFSSNPEVEAKILKIISDQMGVKEIDLNRDTKFLDLGTDSLDMVELVMEAEETFDLIIPDEDIEDIKTVGEAINFVTNQLKI